MTPSWFSHLVRGGRWFLFAERSGSLYFLDLDADVITPEILIPSPFEANTTAIFCVSVDMDADSPVLAFNVLGLL